VGRSCPLTPETPTPCGHAPGRWDSRTQHPAQSHFFDLRNGSTNRSFTAVYEMRDEVESSESVTPLGQMLGTRAYIFVASSSSYMQEQVTRALPSRQAQVVFEHIALVRGSECGFSPLTDVNQQLKVWGLVGRLHLCEAVDAACVPLQVSTSFLLATGCAGCMWALPLRATQGTCCKRPGSQPWKCLDTIT